MKMIKTEVIHEDDDGDDSHVLLGFDESTNYLQSKSASETDTPKTEMTPNGGGAAGGGGVGPYFRWTPESIKMMLSMRFEMDRDFAQRLRQKKDLWNEIATEMGRSGGYAITGEVCDLKFRNMLQTFKKNRRKEERGMQELIIWEYYTLFKQAALHSIDAGGDSFTPSMLCESVCIDDTTTMEGASATKQQQQQQHNEKVAVPDLAAEADKGRGDSLITPKKQSARRKRPRSISTQAAVNSEGSSGEQDQLSIEAKKALLQLEQISLEQQQSSSSPATENSEQISEQQCHPSETSSSAFSKIESQVAWTMHPPPAPQSQLATSQQPPPPPPPLPPPPPTPQAEWLTPTEQSECEVFGQSVGLQLANLRDPFARSLLKLKIQELFFLATMGKLPSMSGN